MADACHRCGRPRLLHARLRGYQCGCWRRRIAPGLIMLSPGAPHGIPKHTLPRVPDRLSNRCVQISGIEIADPDQPWPVANMQVAALARDHADLLQIVQLAV